MSLRDDCRWLVDATDCMVHGALPTWPREWSTATGKLLGTRIQALHQLWVDTVMHSGWLSAENARLKADVNGLRATNELLTNMLEKPVDAK